MRGQSMRKLLVGALAVALLFLGLLPLVPLLNPLLRQLRWVTVDEV
jgi:hypothetical protein